MYKRCCMDTAQDVKEEYEGRIKELEEALDNITSKAERYMACNECNDFTIFIEISRRILNKGKHE